jgi:hypothetical protein
MVGPSGVAVLLGHDGKRIARTLQQPVQPWPRPDRLPDRPRQTPAG